MNPYAAARIGVLILNAILVVWVVQDAKKRDAKPVVWGIITLLIGIIGWIIYLFARPALPSPQAISGNHPNTGSQTVPGGNKNTHATPQKGQLRAGFRHDGGPSVVPDDIFD